MRTFRTSRPGAGHASWLRLATARALRFARRLPASPWCDHSWSYPFGVDFRPGGSPGAWVSICNRCGRRQYHPAI